MKFDSVTTIYHSKNESKEDVVGCKVIQNLQVSRSSILQISNDRHKKKS